MCSLTTASPIETRCGHELLGDPSRKASRRYSVHSPSFGDPRNSAGRNGPVRSFNRRGLSCIEGWIPKSVSSDGWFGTDDLVKLQCRLEKMLKNKSIRKDVDWEIDEKLDSVSGHIWCHHSFGSTWTHLALCWTLSLGRAVSQRPNGHAAAAEGLAENRRHNRRIRKIFWKLRLKQARFQDQGLNMFEPIEKTGLTG